MDRILEPEDETDKNINLSIAELDKFIDSQRNSLHKLIDGFDTIEGLKQQALDQPIALFNSIMNDRESSLRFSEACLGLNMELPDIDWSLVVLRNKESANDPTRKRATRVDSVRSHIAELHQALAALPALPPSLIDTEVEEKAKKRRRVDSTGPRPSTSFSSTLRLPYPITQHDTSTCASPSTSRQSQEPRFTTISSPATSIPHEGNSIPTPPGGVLRPSTDYPYSEKRPWASKSPGAIAPAQIRSSSSPCPVIPETEPARIDDDAEELVNNAESEQSPSTFKQNWSLAEQHMLERLLVEIPSTVKFRWVRISEAMGGTRTPRQVASRVQKYYQKMKKLGVTIDSSDMGGGGRGGSKATQELDTPSISRGRGSSTRGKPKTGPQYTKSGRRR